MPVLVVNGPNLNLLGVRRPEVYGTATLAELEERCRARGAALGIEVETFQSNHEGAIIDRLHEARGRCDGVVLNPGRSPTTPTPSTTPSRPSPCRWWKSTSPTSTPARSGARGRWCRLPAPPASAGTAPTAYREALEWLAGGKGQAPPR